MATDVGSPQRFFHMPRFQHQAPRQVFYKRPDFAQQQAMQQLTFDGKRMRKAVNRKTIDYNPSVIRYLENRVWQRDQRDLRAIQPDAGCYNDLVPPLGMLNNPMNAVTTKFVRTSTNKVKCPVFVIRWTPEGRRLVTGASSGEFTLWNGLTFNFETILQAHDSPVRAMTWSHNDMWMLTADHSGYVKYWQSNMNNVKMFQAHKEAIREASFSPTDNKFATCSDDGTVRIWDFLRCHEERILRGHGADVKCVDWHPTKGLVVSGSKDSQQPIKFWDPKTGQSLATLHAHKNTVMEVKWNLNGNWLLTASRDHLCKLFDIRNLKEELQVFRGHKKEATAVAWHPVHEGLFASGGSDGSLLFWHVGVEKEVGGMEMAHEGMIWSLAWHPLGHILCSGSNDHTSKFWTRNRPGDKMRDRYNLNLLPGMSEDGMEYDDVEPNSLATIPGMGIPEQLKAAMEQEQSSKEGALEVEMSIPGLDWGVDEVMGKDSKKVPQKKVPYAKPIPAQFQQAWAENKVPILPPSAALSKDRSMEQKVEGKKKTQAELEQEMAALQYTNPQLLEVNTTCLQLLEVNTTYSQLLEVNTTCLQLLEVNTTYSQLLEVNTTCLQLLEVNTTYSQLLEVNTTCLQLLEVNTTYSQLLEVNTTNPQLLEVNTTYPQLLEVNTTYPQLLEVNTTYPQLLEVNTTYPQLLEVNTTYSQLLEVNTTCLQLLEVNTTYSQLLEVNTTNPQLLEQMKMNQMNSDGNMGPPQGPGSMPPFPGPGGPGSSGPPGQQGYAPNMPPQQLPNNMLPPMGPGGMQQSFMQPGQMGPPSGPPSHQGPPQGMMGPSDMQEPQRHPGPPRHMVPQGPHGMGPRGMQGPPGGMMGHPPRGMGLRDPQGPPPQGGMMPPQGNMMGPQGQMQGGMMGPPPRTHGNMPNNYGMGNMQGPQGGMQGPQGGMQGPQGGMQGPHGGMQGPHGGMQGPQGGMQGPQGGMQGPQGGMQGPQGGMQGPQGGMQGPQGGMQGPHGNMQGPPYMQPQGQNSGPMIHGMGQQGPSSKGDHRGPPPNHHMGPSDRQGPGGSVGPDQGSGSYWGDNQQGRRGAQDFDGGQDFHSRGEDSWRPAGPGYQGGNHRGGGHRGGGGSWGPDERFSGGDFRGRRDDRFRGGGPGRPGGRGYAEEYGGQEEGFDSTEEISRGWDSGGRGRHPRGGGPPRGGGHDGYRDDGSSPGGRERPSSMQGMDMASLPPRKRPWQDGPGTGDHEAPDGGRPQRDDGYGPPGRGGRGGWGPGGGPRRGGLPPRGAPRGGGRGR
ncbi:pre-mRNA 3' end processing protein WDR33 isoform X2 [Fundulus heteroclitus]|uniref:pre-mRNA 3' end processing protein WDR33 isoform X2 n=1 Tax=Fundulus heteroclitus TaxID=8078 RepID=UPI00165AEF86|nr:pre-mRNA 3' end processing protein WDR33 isoform X2 [Fundulus heteroclitus]